MAVFNFVLIVCLMILVFASANSNLCQREYGDELLLSQPLLQVSLLGETNLTKKFEGYRITCIKSNLPLNLGSLLNLNILNGGVGCDSVGLQIRIGKLITIKVGVNIYGVKVNPGESYESKCNNLQ